ncbi:Acetyltransferase (GNAT) family Acetyltransferase (GNAT) domain [Trypanosoma vivax]|uniref:Putative acetyltransferase n=1 Tax=Trypanosoma vivax (strain Y486) TaxID=1055687 RepID=G0U5W0_TRYVY|nr:putative acetyltransferase [Trypanosoma vivax]KAH8607914.1 Acetyltransferase (GNAT) family Acetyltransferase (GNAT) domain [Trypanosoma vivax]CCC51261.1 putative acetyltransferase [Trypanosoma vivax Y486]
MTVGGTSDGIRCTVAGKELSPIEGLQIRVLSDPRVVERVRVLDEYCLAVKYSDHYYDTYVRPCAHKFNQVAFYNGMLVGSCTCRLESTDREEEFNLYVMTLAVLEPYRRMGIGTHLLNSILRAVAEETKVRISAVTLHVQVGSFAIEFYRACGFEEVGRVFNYYPNLNECDAMLLRKVVPQPHLHDARRQQNPNTKGGGGKPRKKK